MNHSLHSGLAPNSVADVQIWFQLQDILFAMGGRANTVNCVVKNILNRP